MEPYQKYLTWRTKILTSNDPQTLSQFLEVTKITQEQVNEFKSRAGFDQDLLDYTLKTAKAMLPEIFRTIFKEIQTSRSVQDAERFINMIKKVEEKTGPGGPGSFTQNNFIISDDKYRKILEREARIIGGPTPLIEESRA